MGVILLGLWITIAPQLGVPRPWPTLLVTISGLAVMLLGFLLRKQALSHGDAHTSDAHRPFAENGNFGTTDSPAHDRQEDITAHI